MTYPNEVVSIVPLMKFAASHASRRIYNRHCMSGSEFCATFSNCDVREGVDGSVSTYLTNALQEA
ncbi:uncharacterized protein TRAVEDRAFT_32168 [Trametes versicolor FP-101664 SS1]|uniref:Uncharacterized protein n=1 Tax=Trametes versicolor (strain FP-101664) TaxID=717944 RepID=R7S8I1_TRAVS|nr:uncharacterized protein TRAVEDRAFT_32168 [Trametes versicolor FP-101664 SS1]EIW51967.1 hypothetical protein TRAVEDRAFT_32168 [Trametes versicolor FP-101664 SS1]